MKVARMHLPTELYEQIFEFLPVRFCISFNAEFIKRKKLKSLILVKRWTCLDLHCLKWLKKYDIGGWTIKLTNIATSAGRLDIVQWLHENDFTFGFLTIENAAKNGHLHVVEWLYENRTEPCSPWAMNYAAENGHIDVVKWLHQKFQGSYQYAVQEATANGHLDVIKWLHENGTNCLSLNLIDIAAYHGNLDLVIWLHDNEISGCTKLAMDCAASEGHTQIVKWLHENRFEGCSVDAIDIAAFHGHFEVVKFLYINRTEGDIAAIDLALRNNHPEIAKWLSVHNNMKKGGTEALDENIEECPI